MRLGDFDMRQRAVDALNGEREPLVYLPLSLDDGIVRLVPLVLHRQHGCKTPQNLVMLTQVLGIVVGHLLCSPQYWCLNELKKLSARCALRAEYRQCTRHCSADTSGAPLPTMPLGPPSVPRQRLPRWLQLFPAEPAHADAG